MVKEVKKKLIIGDLAPDFTTKTQSGEEITLSKLTASGKNVLLVFYPGDDTPGCTHQLCGIRDVYKEYEAANVRVLGVNHADSKSHQKFIDKYNYQFDIIVDENKEITEKYGAIKMFFKNRVIERGVYLIDSDNIIRYVFWGQQDNQKVLNMLKSN